MMKFKIFVLFVLTMCISSMAYSQQTKFSLDIRNQSIKEVLQQIESKSAYRFISANERVNLDKKVSLQVTDQTVENILKRLLNPENIRYEITANNLIIIYSVEKNRSDKTNTSTISQPKRTISGYIYDASSRETLIGGTVYDGNSEKGTVSNNYGFYSISLPQGVVALSTSYVGYNTKEQHFNLTHDTVINWDLSLFTTLQEVIVEARKGALSNVENTQLGAMSLPPAMVKSVPAILGEVDLLKVLQQTPGVSVGTEGFSGMYVRGGNKDQNLYLIDGNPVYDANHLFGFFSTFNSDAIKSTDFYKSSFPARFGGRLSSVVDVRTKDGNMQEYHGSFTIGLISAKAQFEGPIIKDKASFNIALRRTYLDAITRPVLWYTNSMSKEEKIKFNYYFYDLNAKLNYKLSDRSRIYLNWYSGKDAFDLQQDYKFNNEYDKTASSSEYGVDWNWGNKIASANWNYIFSSKLFGNISAIYSRYNSKIRLRDTWEVKEDNTLMNEGSTKMNYDSGIEDIGYRMDFDFTPQPNHAIKFGSNYLFHTFRPEESGTTFSNSYEGVAQSSDTTNFHNDKIHAHEWAVYAEDNITITPRLKANIGLNFSLFNVEKKTYTSLQPRVSVRYLINKDLSVKASYSMMNQYVHLLSSSTINLPTDLWVPATKNIRPMLSNQFSAAVFYNLKKEYDFSLEAYYKTMDNVIEYKDGASMFASSANWQERVAPGKGRSYGVELMVQKSAGKLTGWIGYGLSWTDRQYPNGEINGGRRFYAKYDNRHKINIVASYKFSPKFDISASWTYYSGNWMTVAMEHYETPPHMPGNTNPDNNYGGGYGGGYGSGRDNTPYYSSRNNYRMSDYHRLDIGFNFYRPKKRGRMGIWNLSFYNAYSRMNPIMAYPSSKYGVVDAQGNAIIRKNVMTEYSIFPIIPSFSYTYKF